MAANKSCFDANAMTEMLHQQIIDCLPYDNSFLFVDKIIKINEDGISGKYKFNKDNALFAGHFKDMKVIPGVLLLEVIGQIGLVSLGAYLLELHQKQKQFYPVLSHLEADFLMMVHPDDTVVVHSEKVYFRNNILKCKVEMHNDNKEVVMRASVLCTFNFQL